MKSTRFFTLLVSALLAIGAVLARRAPESPEASAVLSSAPLVGDVRTLLAGYERFLALRAERGELDRLELPLSWSKGRSVEETRAHGRATLELARESIAIEVEGLDDDRPLEAWLVEYRAGLGASFDPLRDERHVLLGALRPSDGIAALRVPFEAVLPAPFELERIVIARAGAGPVEGGLLFGSPSLFERLARHDARHADPLPGGILLAAATSTPFSLGTAPPPVDPSALSTLVARGELLFFKETFDGNGRTCGTCHPAENNTTLDPDFIATLSPDDPLFVAETNPDLDSSRNGGLVFENPTLMREHGLVVVNPDGFGDLRTRYTLRAVPHVLGLVRTIHGPDDPFPPHDRTGWSGDGAPGGGTLREFATGSVKQHFTRTMVRTAGRDFRLPTPDELSALEAFQLSLGNPVEPDVSAITLLDPDAEVGRALFQNAIGTCFICHFDAGAIPFGRTYNATLDTGVEAFTHNHPDGTGELRPIDGGFGTTPEGEFDEILANRDGSYGNGHFGIPSLIEAADTLPSFHSNLTLLTGNRFGDTIEGAIEFYNSDEFAAASGLGGDTPIDLEDVHIEQLGAFLRALNALENERAARALAERALDELALSSPDLARVTRLAELAALESEDGVKVLGAVAMNPIAEALLEDARLCFKRARQGTAKERVAELRAAVDLLAAARSDVAIE